MATNTERLCERCVRFGYYKKTFRGMEPVCRWGLNFNFERYCYENEYAQSCQTYDEKAQKIPPQNLH